MGIFFLVFDVFLCVIHVILGVSYRWVSVENSQKFLIDGGFPSTEGFFIGGGFAHAHMGRRLPPNLSLAVEHAKKNKQDLLSGNIQ